MDKGNPSAWIGWLALALACSASAGGQVTTPMGQEDRATGAAGGAQSELRWPLEVTVGDQRVTIYQPQLESFKGDKLSARAAVAIQKTGQAEPTFGAAWIDSRVATDRAARTVEILDVKVARTRFPNAADSEAQVLTDVLQRSLENQPVTLSLDQLLAMLAVVEREQKADEKLLSTPPKIVFRAHPAVLVQFDGPPRLSPLDDSKLMRAVNTPFLVILDPATKTYYLKGAGQWFSSADALGPYQSTKSVPAAVQQVADQSGYKDAAELAGDTPDTAIEIITATEPTELIWTDGPPEMGAIAGTDLLYVTNTDADTFLRIGTQEIYVLLSGRWFMAARREGPWTYVPADKLPADFARIPPGSAKGDVLAHVAGTSAAQDATLDNYVPQTAAIDRQRVALPKVAYDGEPKFEPVEGAPITYAVNTASAVLCVSDRYYCCENAVWYVGPAPIGPWEVCTVVPPVIYTLPPSCPLYPVKYVYVYEATPEVVYCGYTPGYVGCYVYGGAVVFGTGYVYPAWHGAAYYPRPCTFGCCAHYNAYTGNWGFTCGVAGPNGWLAVHGGTYGWWAGGHVGGGGWWGYGGYRDVDFNRNVNITHNEWNVNRGGPPPVHDTVYARRGDVRGDLAHGAARTPDAARPRADASGAERGARPQAGRASNDIYVDRDGNVYRKTMDGWEQHDQGRWSSSERTTPQRSGAGAQPTARTGADAQPTARPGAGEQPTARPDRSDTAQRQQSLERDYRARAAGQQRTRDYGRSAPSASRGRGGRR